MKSKATRYRNYLIFTVFIMAVVTFGLTALSRYFNFENNSKYYLFCLILTGISLGGIGVLVIIEFMSTFFDKKASILTLFVAITIFIMSVLSSDFYLIIKYFNKFDINMLYIKYSQIGIAFFLNLILIFVIVHLINILSFNVPKRFMLAFVIFMLATPFISLTGVGSIVLAFADMIILSILAFVIIKKDKLYLVVTYELLICYAVIFYGLCNFLAYNFNNAFTSFGISNLFLIFIFWIFLLVYLDFIIGKTVDADNKAIIEKRMEVLQTSILKNQIDPHFFFNALQIVKASYSENHDKGDHTLDLLSSYMRDYVAAAHNYIVPFEEEINVIDKYVEIVNLKYANKIKIIYNIDVYNFEVPYFGLQPFIENSCKYSKIHEKEDGYILISTYEDDSFFFIAIKDNGIGFNLEDIKNKSYGIANSMERFSLAINATVDIESEVGKGCNIIIKIPKEIKK